MSKLGDIIFEHSTKVLRLPARTMAGALTSEQAATLHVDLNCKAEEEIKALMLELVGEDEKVDENADSEDYGRAVGRNDLRDYLRANIKSL